MRTVEVTCKDCGVQWLKHAHSIKGWLGRCASCSSKEVASRPEMKERMRQNGLAVTARYGGVPNAVKFTAEQVKGAANVNWKGGKPKCLDCNAQLKKRGSKRCHPCGARAMAADPTWRENKSRAVPRGSAHYKWKGGPGEDGGKIRRSRKYHNWRRKVQLRDNFKCVLCGYQSRGINGKADIHVDHIKPFALFPQLRFDVGNGRVLCVPCHRAYGWAGRSNEQISAER